MIKVTVDDFILSYLKDIAGYNFTDDSLLNIRIGVVIVRRRMGMSWKIGWWSVFTKYDDDRRFDAFLKEFYPEVFL